MVRELISNLMGFYFSLRDGLKGKDVELERTENCNWICRNEMYPPPLAKSRLCKCSTVNIWILTELQEWQGILFESKSPIYVHSIGSTKGLLVRIT